MYHCRYLLLIVACFAFAPAFSQTDTTVIRVDSAMSNPNAKRDPAFEPKKDTTVTVNAVKEIEQKPAVVKSPERLRLERLPGRAVRSSAILPGLGQIQNGRWWKVPIIYGGFVGMGLMIEFNHRYYKEFLGELKYYNVNRRWKNELYNERDYPYSSVVAAKDFYRRNRDFSILLTGALYAVNLIDAYVDAKFFRYDISDDLALKISPSVQPSLSYSYVAPVPAIKIKLSL